MIQPIHLYFFRAFSVVFTMSLALVPFAMDTAHMSSLAIFPVLVVLSLILIAIAEQKLLHKVNWQRRQPVKVHKIHLKPVRFRKHAGCRLLGLACAA